MEHFFVCVRYLHLNSDFFLDIQICNVKPIPEPNPIVLASDIPEKSQDFTIIMTLRGFSAIDRSIKALSTKKMNLR